MRQILRSFLLLLILAVPCLAQETPAWQLFGGYSFQRAGVRDYFKSTPIIYTARHDSVNMNGFEFSATENRNQWFGGTLDLSAHFKTPQIGTVSNQERTYSIFYGPRISYPHTIRGGSAYVHALFGAVHNSVSVTPTGPHASDFTFGVAVGGGFDLPLRNEWSVRVLQVDYVRTSAYGSGQNNFRLSAGFVFNTGKVK